MKVMNELQIQQVSGAGFMADMGWSDFGELLMFAYERKLGGADLLSLRPSGGGDSDVKSSYLQWCSENDIDAVLVAKNNGWSL